MVPYRVTSLGLCFGCLGWYSFFGSPWAWRISAHRGQLPGQALGLVKFVVGCQVPFFFFFSFDSSPSFSWYRPAARQQAPAIRSMVPMRISIRPQAPLQAAPRGPPRRLPPCEARSRCLSLQPFRWPRQARQGGRSQAPPGLLARVRPGTT